MNRAVDLRAEAAVERKKARVQLCKTMKKNQSRHLCSGPDKKLGRRGRMRALRKVRPKRAMLVVLEAMMALNHRCLLQVKSKMGVKERRKIFANPRNKQNKPALKSLSQAEERRVLATKILHLNQRIQRRLKKWR